MPLPTTACARTPILRKRLEVHLSVAAEAGQHAAHDAKAQGGRTSGGHETFWAADMPQDLYHCEYCDRTFVYTPAARRRHFEGKNHRRNVKLYYDAVAGVCV